jgi:hypothetical protein
MNVEEILRRAEESEKTYDWSGATELYEKALNSLPKDAHSIAGEVNEKLAYALYRHAFQAANNEEFKERLSRAALDYDKAIRFYENLPQSARMSRILRCNAMKAYIGSWMASQAVEKKKFIDECWSLAGESLKSFEKADEGLEYANTYIQLSGSAIFAFTRESDFKRRERIMQEAMESGEKAIGFLSESDDEFRLAKAYALAVVFDGVFGYYFLDLEEREKFLQKGLGYWAKAKEISEIAAVTESIYPVFGGQPFFGLEGTDKAIANYEKASEYGRKAKDNFIQGCALDWLLYHTAWKINACEDPEAGGRLIEKATHYAEEARRLFSTISFVSPRGDLVWLGVIEIASLLWSVVYDTDVKKKRLILERALQALPSARKRAEESGYPEIQGFMTTSEASLLIGQSQSETDLIVKKRLLEEALTYGRKSLEMVEKFEPFLYWNRGVMRNFLSTIRTGLANLAAESEIKKALLEEAIIDREEATKFMIKELTFQERRGEATSLFGTVGGQYSTFGNLLLSLYELTYDRKLLDKAMKVYDEAIKFFQKLDLVTHVAEAYWKKARAHDISGEHMLAYQNFEMARANFAFASDRIRPLRDFYHDQAEYMHAWSQIEKAKRHHEKQEYGLAEEHFEKASRLHEQLKRWNYLSPNYAAWAKMDHAEDFSRNEDSEKALQSFKEAANLFEETTKSLQNQLDKIEDFEERQMIKSMLKGTALRHQYCIARTAVEEAKILDKKGDHFSSSEKYSSAAVTMGKLSETADSESDKKELALTAILSQAWTKMTLAEAEENPAPYLEASQLFEKAKDLISSEKARTETLGHSRFCMALEAGMRFADTGDEALHMAAVQHLESASRYYLKAGQQSASEYAKATGLLLDAYSHINAAKRETDPEKKSRLLAVSEKILQTSAGHFMKAEHPEKREQVLRLLENVKEERELAQSLNEVLHTPLIASTTRAFSTLAPSQESSIGTEKLESANVQANLKARPKQIEIGEHLEINVELVNAGKGPAQLIKIAELVPSGFEPVERLGSMKLEDSYVDLKGKLLGPLKTEELKLVFKSKVQGTFILKPTILYLDENGRYKSYEPEPVNVTVKELGIKGWLKG